MDVPSPDMDIESSSQAHLQPAYPQAHQMARPTNGKAKLYDPGDAPAKAKAGVGGLLVLVFLPVWNVPS